jgi:hypothetical protein
MIESERFIMAGDENEKMFRCLKEGNVRCEVIRHWVTLG